MAEQPHLQIFNPQEHDQRTFHRFPHFTPEIRLKIWRHAFQRQRKIPVFLHSGSEQVNDDGETEWVWGNVWSTLPQQPYGIFVAGRRLMNKFLRVCQESRAEVLRFYRVHIPCYLSTDPDNLGQFIDPDTTKRGTLYFNPEHDFLMISGSKQPMYMPDMFFVDFITRLKTVYDPRRIGVRNLLIDRWDFERFLSHNQHGREFTNIAESFSTAIQQLQTVWFFHIRNFGRVNIGPLSGTSSTDIFFTRSFPILPMVTPNFELLGPDPRPITQDLKKLNVHDPRFLFSIWQAALRQWGVPRSNSTVYKYLLAYGQTYAYDRATARKLLEWEDKEWRNPEIGKWQTVELEDLEKAVRPAFGFWLFPVDAFGPFTPDGEPVPNGETYEREFKDVSGFYPELALSLMP